MSRVLYFQIKLLLFASILLEASNASNATDRPIVMWHGMGDTCCFPFSLGSIKKLLEQELSQGVYVKSLKIGGTIILDYESGFFIHPNKQIDYVCKELASDERLAGGYNAIGFSQGGQFLRAVAQRCPQPPMKALISIGGQHQGVFGLPKCPSLKKNTCEYIRELLNHAAYEDWVQRSLVQATYWHNPLKEDEYLKKSTFLSDINSNNASYATNLNKLEKFIMVKFMNDTIVQPKESQWFEFYDPGQDEKILPLAQSKVYHDLGLDRMDMLNKLHFLQVEGDHLQITRDWFVQHLIPYLKS